MDIFQEEGVFHHEKLRTETFYQKNHRKSLAYRLERYGQQPPVPHLTVLVPTVPSRAPFFDTLMLELARQGLRVIWDDTEDIPIGEKRNRLLAQVTTPYLTFIDDDDWIAHDYGLSILRAIEAEMGVDYIVFDMVFYLYQEAGQLVKSGIEYDGWSVPGEHFYRDSMHIMCWRTALAQQCQFDNDRRWAEDYEWCRQVIKKVTHQARIEKVLYVYEFLAEKSLTRQYQELSQQ